MEQEVTCDNIRKLHSPVTYNETKFEHSLTYNREDGSQVGMVLLHLPGSLPTFVTVIIPAEHEQNEEIATQSIQQISLSIDELRVRHAFEGYLLQSGLVG